MGDYRFGMEPLALQSGVGVHDTPVGFRWWCIFRAPRDQAQRSQEKASRADRPWRNRDRHFLSGFFSVHFCGFHAGHSVFLRQFFPVEGMPNDGFGRAFMNPPLLWMLVFKHLMKPYGIFVIPALIAERKHVFLPLIKAAATVRVGVDLDYPIKEGVKGKRSKRGRLVGDAMGRPYINVVRMHLLIFFFAFCHALKIDSFLIYAVVYFVYFFPWYEIKNQ